MKTRQSIKKRISQLGGRKKRKNKQKDFFLPAVAKIASEFVPVAAQKILSGGKRRKKRRKKKRNKTNSSKNMKRKIERKTKKN